MITLKNLIPVVEEFLLGDATSKKILNPDVVGLDDVINARVTEVTAKEDTPVIWVVLPKDENTEDEF